MRHNRKRIILVFLSGVLALPFGVLAQGNLENKKSSTYVFSSSQRDPFSPLVSKNGLILIVREIDIAGMVLGGIIYSQGESVAIVNDEVVKTGGFVGEYKVLSIEEKRVVLEKDGQEFILKLEE
ncbi:MAG: hypothetical protein KKH93_00100 [Candidatus Omnitrophica bacterium]|nr:hypothetical protein [Candidatus Omnitrophota bacterium]MBU2043828.1 hypothetical protein [Candidatus Omnitrophota bacterium]MBU2251143.1 hypothetical protein [Candidatus Omnitrophota bacterium]MBU2473166.1 hypothetical protein [Candidatus Omnitrophota bacterium]